MNLTHLLSADFWNAPGHFVVGEWSGEMPDLHDCESSVIFRTSGSTGEGKWIVLEKKSMLLSAHAVNLWLRVDKGSKWGLALPADHVGGFSVIARTFKAGCAMAQFPGKWDAEKFSRWIAEEKITHSSLVPTQLHDLVLASVSPPDSLKAIVIGGGLLSESLGQAARDAGWPVLASYGMTEAGSQIATQRSDCFDRPFSDCPLEILPIWQAETDDNGLLLISGDALFCGTINGEGKNRHFIPRPTGSFLTNDRASVVGNKLQPLGRADSLVKIMGVLIDTEAIEKRFLEISAGRFCEGKFAIIALRDSRHEHVLVAVFEGEEKPGCLEDYNRQAPGIERITKSMVIDRFPRTALGKLKRKHLAEICEVLPKRGGL